MKDLVDMVKKNSMKEQLTYWITERENILNKKQAGLPKPWSDDPVFQTTYFCNVHREDDKVTRWIREHYTADQPNLEARLMMARLVNRIETLMWLGPMFEWDPKHFKFIEGRISPFWGNAYVVTTHGRKMSKADYVCEVVGAAFDYPPTLPHGINLAAAHGALTAYEGFGSFMAAQVVADLKNTRGHALAEAPDWFTWSAHGPGSLRGLSWYFGSTITPATYQNSIQRVADEISWQGCMQDLQNCLCEFDKYMRVKTESGRSKRKYDGS